MPNAEVDSLILPPARSACKVVITRPRHAATRLRSLLEQQGFNVIHYPMLAVRSVINDSEQAQQALMTALGWQASWSAMIKNFVKDTVTPFDRVIFVSVNAVRYTAACIDQLEPSEQQLLDGIFKQSLCVGMGITTEQAIAEQGWHLQSHGLDALRTEDLLQMPWMSQASLAGKTVLICRGVGGRTTLGDNLEARGAQLHYLESYARLRPALSEAESVAFVNDLIDQSLFHKQSVYKKDQQNKDAQKQGVYKKGYIVLSSGETANNFFTCLKEHLSHNGVSATGLGATGLGAAGSSLQIGSQTQTMLEQLAEVLSHWVFVLPSLRVQQALSKTYLKDLISLQLLDGAARFDSMVASSASDKAITDAIVSSYTSHAIKKQFSSSKLSKS